MTVGYRVHLGVQQQVVEQAKGRGGGFGGKIERKEGEKEREAES